MRRGDADRDIARRRLMGRAKLAAVRQEAQSRGWLDPAHRLPEDAEIANAFNSIPRQVPSSSISTAEPYREQVRECSPPACRAPQSTRPFSAIMAIPAVTTP
jgi:hypothetical protein